MFVGGGVPRAIPGSETASPRRGEGAGQPRGQRSPYIDYSNLYYKALYFLCSIMLVVCFHVCYLLEIVGSIINALIWSMYYVNVVSEIRF